MLTSLSLLSLPPPSLLLPFSPLLLPSLPPSLPALHFGAESGSVPVVTKLLNLGAHIDQVTHPSRCRHQNGWSALHFAADKGNLEVVKLLISRGASIDILTAAGEVRILYYII